MSSTDECLNVRIVRREDVAAGIVSLELAAVDGGDLPSFEPGAHIDVHVAPGLIRQYSLCNNPAETHRYQLGVLLDEASRGGSAGIHRDFTVGQVIRISSPRCNFKLTPQAKRSILIAGGIGVTPLISMAYHLHAEGNDYTLHYCTRSRERTAFLDELTASALAPNVRLHHDNGPESARFNLDSCLPAVDPDIHLYVCGPSGFIKFVTEGAKARGWKDSQIHVEHFGATVTTAGAPFTVVASVSGVSVEVQPGQTIAQALQAAGVDVPLSCEQGVCGTCLTRVLEGMPDHHDLYQTDEEKAANTHMTPCCSRALSARLVLEI